MTDTTWMTRREAAAHLRVSVRQTYRLLLPHTIVGRTRRYSREALDQYMHSRTWVPPEHTKGGPKPPLSSFTPMDIDEQISRMKTKLKPKRRRH